MKSAIETSTNFVHVLTARWHENFDDGRAMLHWLMGARAATQDSDIHDELTFLWEIQMIRTYGAFAAIGGTA